MDSPAVFMDNHSTTRVDPRVVAAMLPFFDSAYGNPGSVNHAFGWEADEAVERARSGIATALAVRDKEIVFTSGATESNNLAIFGVARRPRRRGDHFISVATEHRAVLDPLRRLETEGCRVTFLDVEPQVVNGSVNPRAGWLDPQRLAETINDETALVSVMLANNEVGNLQPLAEIAEICRAREVPLHCDATQAVGKIPVDVDALGVDLVSFSGHKMYGPKGVGGLVVRRLRLAPMIFGGGQERGRRSGTLNVPGIVGLAEALRLCLDELPAEAERLAGLRDRLWQGLTDRLDGVSLNGPALQSDLRLAGNLNASFDFVDGEALMMSVKQLAVSSGSACTSADPEPSHVLRALGLDEDRVRASLRFGLGRFNTEAEVDFAVDAVSAAVEKLRKLSSMA